MYNLESSTQFKKDYKALTPSDTKLLETALGILASTGTLPYDPYLTLDGIRLVALRGDSAAEVIDKDAEE